jgi:dTDP-glucose pyrophosphorylase
MEHSKYVIADFKSVKDALVRLDFLSTDAILFVIGADFNLLGSITDGDIRRGLINGLSMDFPLTAFMNSKPKSIIHSKYDIKEIIELRSRNFLIFPVVNDSNQIIDIVNFRNLKSYLPICAVIMAGGRGERLKPLTDTTPKPLLKVGKKPIIEHNIDRLSTYGIDDIWISVRYLGKQIEDYFQDGSSKSLRIRYVWEDVALGTIGAVSKIHNFVHDYVLVMNSDLLTNIDYEHLFLDFIKKEADFAVVSIPYQVNIPYAVLETHDGQIKSFKEKPTYTYYSNGGIYIMKKSVLQHLPKDTFFNATDLIDKLITENLKVIYYPLVGYWLDIGKHEDFNKAQEDIKQIKF